MRVEHRYFDVFPRVVRADGEATITVRSPLDPFRFIPGESYEVTLYPTEGLADGPGAPLALQLQDGALSIRYYFAGEQEHVLLIDKVTEQGKSHLAELRVYSLADDLFERRPYKGDLHIHSVRSDGKEMPPYVAAASRRIGMDFMAVTDHGQYAPSLEAIQAFVNAPIDLRIYPGEEVHPPDNPVHIVNFGGSFSVNELFAMDSYRSEVKALEETLGSLPPGIDRYQFASCLWCFDKIREAGGLGILCHPYWFFQHRYNVPTALMTALLEAFPFDALEVISGYSRNAAESNVLQIARYYEEQGWGRQVPIVGVSDAHGCETGELFGWYYTLIFSPSLELPDLAESIKSLYSVAVEAMPGETARVHGPFRLVKYASFLLREVLPQHDELCAQEGWQMLAYLSGDNRALEGLRLCHGQTRELYEHLWDRKDVQQETLKYIRRKKGKR